MSVNSVIRSLMEQLKTPEAIAEYLAAPVKSERTGLITYNDLLKSGAMSLDEIAVFDKSLAAADHDWLRAALSGTGVELADPKVQALLADIKEDVAKVQAFVSTESTNWQEIGLAGPMTAKEVQAEMDAMVVDGRAISISLQVTPDRSSVALSVRNAAGPELLDTIESFATSSPDDERLTKQQRAFVADLLALVASYGN